MWGKQKIIVPVEVSARHCHLSREDADKIFGVGYEFKKIKQLSQPSEFACEENVAVQFGTKKIEKVRVVGPLRKQTQVEISLTDAIGSGITPEVRLSGQLARTSPITITGPKGAVELSEGLIVALRHLHCATTEAVKLGLKNNDKVAVRIEGERAVVFENVPVRVKDDYELSFHIDTDEGNAAGINKTSEGFLIK